MFSFFRKKPPAPPPQAVPEAASAPVPAPTLPEMTPAAAPVATPPAMPAPTTAAIGTLATSAPASTTAVAAVPTPAPAPAPERRGWLDKLKAGLRKTGSSIATVFTGTQIDDALYEELESALLMADTGVKATEHLLADLKKRVKDTKTTDPAAVKGLLDRKSTRLNSSHIQKSRMPSSA